jgi:hypothetical protein
MDVRQQPTIVGHSPHNTPLKGQGQTLKLNLGKLVIYEEKKFQSRDRWHRVEVRRKNCAPHLGRYDIQHNDTQHNDIQHNDTQHNDTQHNDTQHNDTQHNDT